MELRVLIVGLPKHPLLAIAGLTKPDDLVHDLINSIFAELAKLAQEGAVAQSRPWSFGLFLAKHDGAWALCPGSRDAGALSKRNKSVRATYMTHDAWLDPTKPVAAYFSKANVPSDAFAVVMDWSPAKMTRGRRVTAPTQPTIPEVPTWEIVSVQEPSVKISVLITGIARTVILAPVARHHTVATILAVARTTVAKLARDRAPALCGVVSRRSISPSKTMARGRLARGRLTLARANFGHSRGASPPLWHGT